MLTKKEQRLRRARQTRIRIATQGVARLTVNRTNLHIYASVISGDGGKVLATASTAEVEVRKALGGKGSNVAAAQAIGKRLAEKAKAGMTCQSVNPASREPMLNAAWALNVRCLDGVDPQALEIQPFDGRSR